MIGALKSEKLIKSTGPYTAGYDFRNAALHRLENSHSINQQCFDRKLHPLIVAGFGGESAEFRSLGNANSLMGLESIPKAIETRMKKAR